MIAGRARQQDVGPKSDRRKFVDGGPTDGSLWTEVQWTEVSSDEPRSNDGSVVACNAATAMAVQRATLLLLLLELAAMVLLQL